MFKLAKVIDKTAIKYDVDVILTTWYTVIRFLTDNAERIFMFAKEKI